MSTSISAALWHTHLLTLRNTLRFEKRLRVLLFSSLIFSVASGIWSSDKLVGLLLHWQQQGATALNTGLWLYCLSTWGGMSIFAALGIPRALESAEVALLFTLPIQPAVRFRMLITTFFLENLWLWFLFQALLLAYVFISVLSWQALAWLIVLQLGVVLCVCILLLAALLLLRYLWPGGTLKGRVGIVVGGVSLLILCVICTPTFVIYISQLQPWLLSLLFLLLLVLILGPLAAACGQCYIAVFLIMQNRDRAKRPFTLLGARALQRLFARRPTFMAAAYSKSVMSQGRNIFFWLRFLLTWSALAFFPWLHITVQRYAFADAPLVVGYAAALVLVHIIETAPSALSSEGNRLAIYLTAPFSLTHLLLVKWAQFLFPAIVEGLLIVLLLSCWLKLPFIQSMWAFVVLLLIVTSITALLVGGSAWDTDLNLSVEGLMETIMHEEVPFTPRRIILFNLCIMLFMAILLLLWKLPALLTLLVLILFTAGLLLGMWRFALAQLHRLLRYG